MRRNATPAFLGLAAAMLAAAALAQDTSTTTPAPAGEVGSKPADDKAAKPPTPSPVPAGEAGSRSGEGSGSKAPDDAAAPGSSKSTPQHFEPTEKVRPDFDVAFPIDI